MDGETLLKYRSVWRGKMWLTGNKKKYFFFEEGGDFLTTIPEPVYATFQDRSSP